MKASRAAAAMLGVNAILIAVLISGLWARFKVESAQLPRETEPAEIPNPNEPPKAPLQATPAKQNSPDTPFKAVYSPDSGRFAENLRQVGCPEETVKDILRAEIGRRFKSQEQELRAKPEDHVPWTWSARTWEGKLVERRQAAAEIAREKESLLQNALGYHVPVARPSYAVTISEQKFEEALDSLPPAKQEAARQIHEYYWSRVADLRARTRGFWEPEDIAALEQLKRDRQVSLDELTNAP